MILTWKNAVITALECYSKQHQTIQVNRNHFISSELDAIVKLTRSVGMTPSQTLSRILQELRDEGYLFFSSSGVYVLNTVKFDATKEDFTEDVLENAVIKGNLVLSDVVTSSELAQVRLRKGVAALRNATLHNYSEKCALCDITDTSLLVTSHIARWADLTEARGKLDNTICFCSLHDKLFELGYFIITDRLETVFRQGLKSKVIETWKNECTWKFSAPKISSPNVEFLRMHRERVKQFYAH
jgi:hypothetical protein